MHENIIQPYFQYENSTFFVTSGYELINQVPRGLFILDFSIKFEEPNLDVLPARFIPIYTKKDYYLAKKYHYILGENKQNG